MSKFTWHHEDKSAQRNEVRCCAVLAYLEVDLAAERTVRAMALGFARQLSRDLANANRTIDGLRQENAMLRDKLQFAMSSQ